MSTADSCPRLIWSAGRIPATLCASCAVNAARDRSKMSNSSCAPTPVACASTLAHLSCGDRTMAEYNKPLPVIETWNAPYWQAAKRHEFVAQQCRACGYTHLPPGPVCTNCLSAEQDWVRLSGKGTIYSYGIYYQLWHPGFKAEIPYNVALVHLAEGPHIISQVVGCKN